MAAIFPCPFQQKVYRTTVGLPSLAKIPGKESLLNFYLPVSLNQPIGVDEWPLLRVTQYQGSIVFVQRSDKNLVSFYSTSYSWLE